MGENMPGICGIISKSSREKNEKDLGLMVDTMMHEPFYTSGTYINSELGLFVGWVCHEDSFSDCMPIFNEKEDLVLFFSGEHFSDREQLHRLKGKSHEFDFSNASYLIHLYEEEGDSFFQHLNGWFNGILVDLEKRKVMLFIDRFGIQRIYYHESKDAFYFSSEAKSLLGVRPELRHIDDESLGEYFACGCILGNKTLFSNVLLLPGGSLWTFENGGSGKKHFYFEPKDWENQPVLESEQFYEKLKEKIIRILPRYFNPQDRIGMSLTGGLDTRMILACRDNTPGSLPCYTFGGMYRDSFDVRISRKVADACNQSHQVIQLGSEFLSDFPDLAEKTIYISEGSSSVSGAAELYANMLAREISPIRMTGNYGSEVLRSVSNLKADSSCGRFLHPDFAGYVRNAVGTFSHISNGHRLTFVAFKQAPWYGHGTLAIEQSQLTLRTPYMDNDLVGLVYQAPKKDTASGDITLRLIADCNPVLGRIMTDLGAVSGKPNYLFSKFVPLFHKFLFKAEYAYNYGMPQWLAKLDHTLAPFHLERLFLGHHKFHHSRVWIRDDLSSYVKEMLLDTRTANRPYLNKEFLEEMVNRHTKGDRNYTIMIDNILTIELIYRLFIEQR
jgi:asparagine synthase (glutamine-hydrolysing)